MANAVTLLEKYPKLTTIAKEKFPKHILIIPDGNGRWAKRLGKPVLEGHRKGADVTEKVLRDLSELQEVNIVTLWGFSSDNWKRDSGEIRGLMRILEYKIAKTLDEVKKTGRRFIHLGRKDRIPQKLLSTLQKAEQETENSKGQIICLAIDFGGEDQEVRLLKAARQLRKNQDFNREILWQLRDTHGLVSSADLLIRTSGEKRTSDIGWLNGAQTELYFLEKFYPDITTDDIVAGIIDFSKRERRFGAR